MKTVNIEETKLKYGSLIWQHISVTIKPKFRLGKKKEVRQLLTNVTGIAQSGEVVAILGGSGVGKTTLMNVLSGRYNQNFDIKGEVYLNNILTTCEQRTHSGLIEYVEQRELFVETMTLEEHLLFQAMLRMPNALNDTERRLRIDDVILQTYLTDCRKTTIAYVSNGERKRLAFATALLTNPCVLLIDEPTSGLDTYLAKSLMNVIQTVAVDHNQTIVVILHQATEAILGYVDKICLMVDDGKQAFFGTKTEAELFFVNEYNLSSKSLDGFIEQLSAPSEIIEDQAIITQQLTSADKYIQSGQMALLNSKITNYLESIDKTNQINQLEEIKTSSFFRQLKWLLWRRWVSIKRNSRRTTNLMLRLLITSLILGFAFFQLNKTTFNYIVNVNAFLLLPFLSILELNLSLIVVEIPLERPMLIWEYRRKLYSLSAYYITRLIIDTSFQIITSVILISILVMMAGLSRWILLVCGVILVIIATCSISTLIAVIFSTPQSALLALQFFVNFLYAFSGYFINLNSIPIYMKWIQYLSSFYYGYHLLLLIQWHHTFLSLPCKRLNIHQKPFLFSNITATQVNTCPIFGDSIINCFQTDYSDLDYYILGLIILSTFYHFAAFIVIFFRIRRVL